MSTALIFWDLPFAKRIASWDGRVLTKEEVVQFFKQIPAFNSAINQTLIFFLEIKTFGVVAEAVEECGWTGVHKFTWIKDKHNAEGVRGYIYASEVFLIAYKPHFKQKQWFHQSNNPEGRPDHVVMPAARDTLIASDGLEINPHRKPWQLMKFFAGIHCRPDDWVLVAGAGSGAEMIGANAAGMNVVGIEKDERQLNELRGTIMEYKERAEHEQAARVQVMKADLVLDDDPVNDPDYTPPPKTSAVEPGSGDEDAPPSPPEKLTKCVACGVDIKREDIATCLKCGVAIHSACGLYGVPKAEGDENHGTFCCDECMDQMGYMASSESQVL
jgi:hypothetical protein